MKAAELNDKLAMAWEQHRSVKICDIPLAAETGLARQSPFKIGDSITMTYRSDTHIRKAYWIVSTEGNYETAEGKLKTPWVRSSDQR